MIPPLASVMRFSWKKSVNCAVKIPVKFEISPVEIRRAVPATEKVAEDPICVLDKVKGESPSGLLAVTRPGMAGVQVCPAAGIAMAHPACPPTPVKINVRSRTISGGTTVPAGLKIIKLGSENDSFTGAVA